MAISSRLRADRGTHGVHPVSSTGHLILAQNWLPRQSDLFNVVIQSGAVLAVLPLFGKRLSQLRNWRSPEGRSLLTLISISFLVTAVGGVMLEKLHFKLPESPKPIAVALIVGGLLFLLSERILRSRVLSTQCTKPTAFLVGLAQLVAAVFPGSSRSGTTIIAAMLAGTSRATATEFSFLVGIPTLLAAAGLKTLKALKAAPRRTGACSRSQPRLRHSFRSFRSNGCSDSCKTTHSQASDCTASFSGPRYFGCYKTQKAHP